MHTIKVELTEAQFKAANQHAERKGLSVGDDLVKVWWGRMQALATYSDRLARGSKMRAYAPLGLSEEERARLKALAVKVGVALAPKAEKPKAEKPKAEKPKAEKPKAEKPKAEKPKAEKPKAEKPKAEKPKAEKPAVAGKMPAPILGTDSPEVAVGKAELIADADGRVSDAAVLKAAGRDPRGNKESAA